MIKRRKTAITIAASVLTIAATESALRADTFGSDPNAFTIDFVTVGNPGNADDAGAGGGLYFTPYGGVAYEFRIGTYELSQDAITKATALGLTNVEAGAWSASQPAANVTWYEAAAFVNYLNTSTGHQAAYNLSWNSTTAWSMITWSSSDAWQLGGENLYRHKGAYYFLPSEDEWYKAAYHKNDGVTANFWDYATGSNTVPTVVISGVGAGTVVYGGGVVVVPAAVNNAGGLSAYGTMAQNGNVFEWLESAAAAPNDSPSERRIHRGGDFHLSDIYLRSDLRPDQVPTFSDNNIGFRVASVPEPSTAAALILGFAVLLSRRSRAT